MLTALVMNKIEFFAPLNQSIEPQLLGIEGVSEFQIPKFHLIGLPSQEVSESKDRIRSAILKSGFHFPKRKIIINLHPANIKKRGTGLDLAIALCILKIEPKNQLNLPFHRILAWGELSLSGTVRKTPQLTRALHTAQVYHFECLLLPLASKTDVITSLKYFKNFKPKIFFINHLSEIKNLLTQEPFDFKSISSKPTFISHSHNETPLLPMSNYLNRLLLLILCGKHHLILLGPKGTGKSHFIDWLKHFENSNFHPFSSQILSILDLNQSKIPSTGKPNIRQISAQVRPSSLIGKLTPFETIPGEFTLAHEGYLIADEFLEWHRDSRELLREPLESGKITLTRINSSQTLPSRFTFLATSNLCECGGWPEFFISTQHPHYKKCTCSIKNIKKYLTKLSGPILDRIDSIGLFLNPVECLTDRNHSTKETEKSLSNKIESIKRNAIRLYSKPPGELTPTEVEEIIKKQELKWIDTELQWSSLRSRHKTIKLALTLSLLDGKETPQKAHLQEAIWYRPEKVIEKILTH